MIRSPLASGFVLSPNVSARRGGRHADMIVLHYTGMASAAAACRWLCTPESKVSCHYLVDDKGAIAQMAGEEMRCWHAGVSSWQGVTDINSRSIGIEIHNPGHELGYPEFPGIQMAAVIALCRDILSRHVIDPHNIVAHSDIAPGRKADPGEKFDWSLLARAGIGHWVEPAPVREDARGATDGDTCRLQNLLARYGYAVSQSGELDQSTRQALLAFQRHFRPQRVNGLPDASSLDTLERLVAALPD